MPRREKVIARSIADAMAKGDRPAHRKANIAAYFYLYWLIFDFVQPDLFESLHHVWNINDGEYHASFKVKSALKGLGDMGYSGSTFFSNGRYLVKSIPRRFENTFFRDDLLQPYAAHMQQNPDSLLIRITDFLQCSQSSLGTLFGMAPSHHILMENLLLGKDDDVANGDKWQSWDLKPRSYFFPERDMRIASALAGEEVLSKLPDDFDGKIVLDMHRAEALKAQLEKDTALLASCNAVDYSLFLVRIPISSPAANSTQEESWRTGIPSADNECIYRLSILDFFWAKHKFTAKAMTGLIRTYNVVGGHGDMSITAPPDEYRQRFLSMMKDNVKIQ